MSRPLSECDSHSVQLSNCSGIFQHFSEEAHHILVGYAFTKRVRRRDSDREVLESLHIDGAVCHAGSVLHEGKQFEKMRPESLRWALC